MKERERVWAGYQGIFKIQGPEGTQMSSAPAAVDTVLTSIPINKSTAFQNFENYVKQLKNKLKSKPNKKEDKERREMRERERERWKPVKGNKNEKERKRRREGGKKEGWKIVFLISHHPEVHILTLGVPNRSSQKRRILFLNSLCYIFGSDSFLKGLPLAFIVVACLILIFWYLRKIRLLMNLFSSQENYGIFFF